MKSEPDDETLKIQLESDLSTLFRLTFTNGPVAEGDVRIAAVILRKWLCDGLIGQLCHRLGHTPTFPVLDNSSILQALTQQPSISYLLTGGVKFDGQPVMAFYNSSAPASEAPLIPLEGLDYILVATSKMLGQQRVFHDGNRFTCEEIIRFTANKLGGAHLDFDRPGRFDAMQRAAEFMTFGGPLDKVRGKPPGELYLELEPKGRAILSGFHIEIVAAASSFIQLRLNGEQLIDFGGVLRPTFMGRIRKLIGLRRRKLRQRLHDFSVDGTPK